MLNLNVSLDVTKVNDYLVDTVQRKALPKATAKTMNLVGQSVLKRAKKIISKDLGLKQSEINKNFSFIKAKSFGGKADFKDIFAVIEAAGKRISISRLKPIQTAAGVTYRSQGKRKLIPGAFIGGATSGNLKPVYKRVGKARTPLHFLRIVDVGTVFTKRVTKRAIREIAIERWGKVWPQQVNFFLGRL